MGTTNTNLKIDHFFEQPPNYTQNTKPLVLSINTVKEQKGIYFSDDKDHSTKFFGYLVYNENAVHHMNPIIGFMW